MNGNKAAALGLGLSNYIDEKNLKLTPKQAAAMLYNELEKYQKLTNTGVTNTINRLHGDISKGNTTTEIYLKNGIQPFSYEFKVFSKEEQEKRKAFQEEYLRKHCEVFGQTQYDQGNFVNKHQILKKSGDRRNLGLFFGGYIKPDDPNLDPEIVFNKLESHLAANLEEKKRTGKRPKISEEDYKLLNDYVRGCAEKCAKTVKIPKNNDEVLETLDTFYRVGQFMSVENLSTSLGLMFECEIPNEFDNTFRNIKNTQQNAWNYSGRNFSMISDPLYTVTDPHSQYEISNFVVQNQLYEQSGTKDNEFAVFETPYEGVKVRDETILDSVFDASEIFKTTPKEVVAQDNADFVKFERKLEDGDIVLDIDGNKIEHNQIQNHLFDGMITVVKKDGSGIKSIGSNEDGILTYLNDNKKVDHKQQYIDMLKSLDSGTRAFNKSSKEYKNMRNILSDLIKGKNGTEQEKLKELKRNAKTYLENFEKKDKKSTLAVERKNIVKGIYSNINDCLYNVAGTSPLLTDKNVAKENTAKSFARYEKEIIARGLKMDDPKVQNFYSQKRNLNIVYTSAQKKEIEGLRTKVKEVGADHNKHNLNETFEKLDKDLEFNVTLYKNVVLGGEQQPEKNHKTIVLNELKNQNNIVVNQQQEHQNVKNIVNEENKNNDLNINNINGR